MNNQKIGQHISLVKRFRMMAMHIFFILASLVIIAGPVILLTFLTKPVYQSTVTIVIKKEQRPSPLSSERLDYESDVFQSLTFKTHFQLIKSRPVLERVIKELDLDRLDREKRLEADSLKRVLSRFVKEKFSMSKQDDTLNPRDRMTQLVEKLKEKIRVEKIRDTRLLKINVENHDPKLAADIANAVSRIYIEMDTDERIKDFHDNLKLMTEQLQKVKKKLESSEKDFLAYKERKKLFSVEGKQKGIAQKMAEFNNVYIKTRNERVELETKLHKLKKLKSGSEVKLSSRSLIDNPFIDTLYGELLASEVELSSIREVFGIKHPKVLQIETKMDNLLEKIRQEFNKELENMKTKRSVLLAKEKILQKNLADFEAEALETNKKELGYVIHQRNVETNQALYSMLLSEIKEMDIIRSMDVSNIRIKEAAAVSLKPVRPKKSLNVVLSIIFGLMTGVIFSFYRSTRPGIKSGAES